MTTHAVSTASLICLGRSSRASLMRTMSPELADGHVTEFQTGMHLARSGASDQVLATNQMLVLEGRRLTLECVEGRLWLTRDGDAEDYILGAGHCFEVRPGDNAMVQALRPSRVRLLPA